MEFLTASLLFNSGWLFSTVQWLNNLSLKIHCLSREQGASKAWQDGWPPLPMSAINAPSGWLDESIGAPESLWPAGEQKEKEREGGREKKRVIPDLLSHCYHGTSSKSSYSSSLLFLHLLFSHISSFTPFPASPPSLSSLPSLLCPPQAPPLTLSFYCCLLFSTSLFCF